MVGYQDNSLGFSEREAKRKKNQYKTEERKEKRENSELRKKNLAERS